MALVAFGFLRLNGLHFGWNTVEYTFPPLVRALPRVFVLGVGLNLLHRLVTRRSVSGLRDYLVAVVRPAWLLGWLRAWIGMMLFVYAYCWLKISVPLLRTALYDQELWKLDRFLHFGLSPNVFAVELVVGTPMARWLDWWYSLWVFSLSFILSYFIATESARRRRNFALGFILLWTVGAWGYQAVPAIGPCYASPDVFEAIRTEMPSAVSTQKLLWNQYLQMVQGRTGLLRSFHPEFGVAAMPSLHVAAHAFFFFWCRRHERWLRTPFALATGLTLLGSVVTGWHYAVDGYAGIALAWGAVALADRLDPIPSPAISDSADGRSEPVETSTLQPPSPTAA